MYGKVIMKSTETNNKQTNCETDVSKGTVGDPKSNGVK
jgi:hypothetical protein